MSNKLDEYREKEANKFYDVREKAIPERGSEAYNGYVVGFDAAMALNLPAKFGQWAQGLVHIFPYRGEYQDSSARSFDGMEEAYKYWLDNIYKPE